MAAGALLAVPLIFLLRRTLTTPEKAPGAAPRPRPGRAAEGTAPAEP